MVRRRSFLLAAGLSLVAMRHAASAQTSGAETIPTPDKKDGLAIALGGGAAKAFAHIPFLEALDELGVRPQLVAGTSMGAIIGSLYCSGMSGKDIRAYGIDTFSDRPALLKRLLLTSGGTWSSLFNIFRPAVIEPEVLLKAILPDTMPTRFEALDIPLKVVATDFYGQSQEVIESGLLLPAISASSALPVLLTPVRVNGRVLIDGGFVNPTPFDLLDGQRYSTVAIDVTGSDREDTGEIPSSLSTWTGSMTITQHSIVMEKLKVSQPDLFIAPAVGQFDAMDFFDIEDIMATAEKEKDVFKQGIDAILS